MTDFVVKTQSPFAFLESSSSLRFGLHPFPLHSAIHDAVLGFFPVLQRVSASRTRTHGTLQHFRQVPAVGVEAAAPSLRHSAALDTCSLAPAAAEPAAHADDTHADDVLRRPVHARRRSATCHAPAHSGAVACQEIQVLRGWPRAACGQYRQCSAHPADSAAPAPTMLGNPGPRAHV